MEGEKRKGVNIEKLGVGGAAGKLNARPWDAELDTSRDCVPIPLGETVFDDNSTP